jgi:Phage integrase family
VVHEERLRDTFHRTVRSIEFRPINKSGTVAASRLTDRSVANIVKEYAGRAGFDAAIFSAHSLRSGFLTSAAAKGASIFKMMDQSGHKSIDTCAVMSVMQNYSRITREPDCFERQRLRREHRARRVELGQAAVKPGVGTGPILRIVEKRSSRRVQSSRA